MSLIFDVSKYTYTHRGLWWQHTATPENSLPSFEASIQQGLGIELDVQLTRDGRALVFHDPDLGRMVRREGTVRDLPLKRLKKIAYKDTKVKLSSLEDALKMISGRAPVLVEVKAHHLSSIDQTTLEKAVIKAVSSYQGHIAIMSFAVESMGRFKKALPNIPCGLLVPGPIKKNTEEHIEAVIALAMAHQIDFLGPKTSILPDFAPRAQKHGFPMVCWTVRHKEMFGLTKKLGIGPIFESLSPDILKAKDE